MADEVTSAVTEARVRLKDGGHGVLTLADVALAALSTPEDVMTHDVFAVVAGRNLPAVTLVRNALDGRDPWNTHAAEIALHELGFSIMVRRRYDKSSGKPVVLKNEQRNGSAV
ncbi:hypothetical protein IAG44_37485 [Streptomyces roseirectus]|uniref:Uncharacterized protein n=1 Tax=Streptomyces roseirectus TaxID=2768066 RepID=A0A7H0IP73_9ACTN|nr:hypothetical protein [Streptomyces roseirectus]QNP74589.1 hypothetical protein IAG44_37485 [Streptomyces roseirectus]